MLFIPTKQVRGENLIICTFQLFSNWRGIFNILSHILMDKEGLYICTAQSPGERSCATSRRRLLAQLTARPSGDGCAVARVGFLTSETCL